MSTLVIIKSLYFTKIGKSIFDEEGSKIVHDLVSKANKNGVKLHFPVDYVCAAKIDEQAETSIYSDESGIPADLMGLDVGPKSREYFDQVVQAANVIVWNGVCNLLLLILV